MVTFKNILCPTDLSASSQEAVRYAVKMADAGVTTIHLLNIVDLPFLMDPYGLNYSDVLLTIKAENRIKLDNFLTDLRSKYSGMRFEADMIDHHDASGKIVEYGNKHECDLIVMASHGRKGIDRILMGSVAESVMRLSEVPVMVVKIKA